MANVTPTLHPDPFNPEFPSSPEWFCPDLRDLVPVDLLTGPHPSDVMETSLIDLLAALCISPARFLDFFQDNQLVTMGSFMTLVLTIRPLDQAEMLLRNSPAALGSYVQLLARLRCFARYLRRSHAEHCRALRSDPILRGNMKLADLVERGFTRASFHQCTLQNHGPCPHWLHWHWDEAWVSLCRACGDCKSPDA